MDAKFWLNDPKILFHKDKLLEVWPYTQLSFNQKINATTRFVIYVSLIGYVFLNNYLILLLGVIIIFILISGVDGACISPRFTAFSWKTCNRGLRQAR